MDKKTVVFAVLFLLVLSGCAGVKTGLTKEQAALTDDAHKGTKGVTLDFVKNSPPDIVYTGTPLDLVVELKNEGAVAVSGGTLYLSGYDSRLFNIAPQNINFDLEATTKFNTFGGYDTKTFSAGNIYLPQGSETLAQTFLASVCYNYRTEARIPVCIDPNPTSVLENEACKVTTPVVGGGQGAPVAISAIKEEAAPGRVGFLITISNLGDGTVVDRASLGKCPAELKFNDVDSVSYSARLSGSGGDCKPVGKARLANKQGTIYCTFVLADATSSAYTSVLEVNLDYAYLSQKSKKITVKSLI